MSIPIQQCVFLLSAISKKEYLRTILSIERTFFLISTPISSSRSFTLLWVGLFYKYKTTFKAFSVIKKNNESFCKIKIFGDPSTMISFAIMSLSMIFFCTANSNIPLTWTMHINKVTHGISPPSRPHQDSINTHN